MKIAFKNFLTTLRRYKVASLLNIAGLTLAFTAFYIIAAQVWYAATYNRGIAEADRIYLLSPRWGTSEEGRDEWSSNAPQPAAYDALAALPEAEAGASLCPYPSHDRVWAKRSEYSYDRYDLRLFALTDDAIDLFGFECVEGDLERYHEPNTVIIARSVAELTGLGVGDQLFTAKRPSPGAPAPTEAHTIVGIFRDFPRNSLLADHRIFYDDHRQMGQQNNNWNYSFFVRLKRGTDPGRYASLFSKYYDEWEEQMYREWLEQEPDSEEAAAGPEPSRVRMIPLTQMYFRGKFFDLHSPYEAGEVRRTAVLAAIALVIVVMAFLNFINFFLALVPVRMQAVNICKVFGADQRTLRWSFVFEAIGLVVLSLALTLYLMIAVQESFIARYVTCSLALRDNLSVIGLILVLLVLLAVLASVWPAFYITRFNASMGVKGGFGRSKTGRRLRLLLTGVPFTVAMILLIVTGVCFLQYRFVTTLDTGFDRSNLLAIQSQAFLQKGEVAIERFEQLPDVTGVTASFGNIPRMGNQSSRIFDGHEIWLSSWGVRWNFPEVMGIKVVEGEGFTPASHERGDYLACNRLRSELGLPIGWKPEMTGTDGAVRGFIENVAFLTVEQEQPYFVLYCSPTPYYWYIYVRFREGADLPALLERLRAILHEIAPDYEEDTTIRLFSDELLEEHYAGTKQSTVTVGLFALLAVVIALMGVFGIVLFEMQQRRREVAIRKVYGATTRQLIGMLNRRYALIVLGCFVIAAPAAWWITTRWLQQFANRITVSPWLYAAALVVVLAVTLGLVTLRSWRTATENPAEVVKSN